MMTFEFYDKNSDMTVVISADSEEDARLQIEQYFLNNGSKNLQLEGSYK